LGNSILDVAHWVGAKTRNAEGSYMQLPVSFDRDSGRNFERIWAIMGRFFKNNNNAKGIGVLLPRYRQLPPFCVGKMAEKD